MKRIVQATAHFVDEHFVTVTTNNADLRKLVAGLCRGGFAIDFT